jgi:hypothetical protein
MLPREIFNIADQEPMGIGQILDRSLRLTPGIFVKLSIWYLGLAGLTTGGVYLLASREFAKVLSGVGCLFVAIILSIPLYFLVVLLSKEHWFGNTDAGVFDVASGISFRLAFRAIGLFIWVGFFTFLWSMLLIIPGLIYMFNRALSFYILVIDDTGVLESVDKSKFLMTRERWWKRRSPALRLSGIFLVHFLVSLVFNFLSQGAGHLFAQPGDLTSTVALSVQFFSTFASYFAGLFAGISMIGFYYDLCTRYEGADILSSIEELKGVGAAT